MRRDCPLGSEGVALMDIRELDRLVSKTELTPTSKLLLRKVRRSIMKGKVAGPPQVGKYTWSVMVEDFGPGAKVTFQLRRANDESSS
jgi:hypothetical protein